MPPAQVEPARLHPSRFHHYQLHHYEAPVRWGDMDAQGHVNNVAYLDYLQDARVDFLHAQGLGSLLDSGVLVVSHQVEYLAPWQFDGGSVDVGLWIDALGGSRFVVGYQVRAPSGVELLRARTAAAPVDLAGSGGTGPAGSGRSGSGLRRLLPAERTVLSSWLAPAEPLRRIVRTPVAGSAHRWPLVVRWSDLDSYGHVNNVRFYDYLQEARIALMVAALGWTGEQVWSLVRQDIEYARPIDFRTEPYAVLTSVAAVGTRSLTLSAAITDPDTGAVFATGRSVVVGERPFTDADRTSLTRWS